MAQHKKLLDRLFTAFIQRKAGKEEQSLFWQWLWGLDARGHEATSALPDHQLIQERLWENISIRTHAAAKGREKKLWKPALTAAAILTGIIITGGIWLLLQPSEKIADKQYVVTSGGGSIKLFVLPDSTQVILNLHSSLQYSTAYNSNERRVILKGEGYFKVHKNNLRPFIVQTDSLETQVLGTAFNIEAREGEEQIRVALTEGKVAVTRLDSPAQKSLLVPGQLVRYDRATRQLATARFTNDVTIWTNGGLSFNGISLTEALDRLAQHYKIQLHYDRKQLSGKTVTASFGKTSWQNALSNILFPHSLEYRIKDGVVLIH
jgi:ferric-dicitrate binding protein FerR (iron transport regulator)